jgi:hypothetical protein
MPNPQPGNDHVVINVDGQIVSFWNGNTMSREVAEERVANASSNTSVARLVPVEVADRIDAAADLDEFRRARLAQAERNGEVIKITGRNSLLTPGETS